MITSCFLKWGCIGKNITAQEHAYKFTYLFKQISPFFCILWLESVHGDVITLANSFDGEHTNNQSAICVM